MKFSCRCVCACVCARICVCVCVWYVAFCIMCKFGKAIEWPSHSWIKFLKFFLAISLALPIYYYFHKPILLAIKNVSLALLHYTSKKERSEQLDWLWVNLCTILTLGQISQCDGSADDCLYYTYTRTDQSMWWECWWLFVLYLH